MQKLHLEFTPVFQRLYKKLSPDIQERVNKTILLLEENTKHPSLHFKKMEGTRNIYEWRISDNYRGTLTKVGKKAYLKKVGNHNMLRNP